MAKNNKETDVLVNKKPVVDSKKEVEEALPAPSLPGTRTPTKLPPKYPSASAALASAKSPAAQRLYKPQPTKLVGEEKELKEQKIQKFMEAFKAFYGVNYKNISEADEPKVKIPIEEPGGLELKKGQDVENASVEHFKKLIQKDGWDTVSKRIITLKVFNRNKKPALSAKMDKLQAKLADWVESKRKEDPNFGK